jgi:hypothetical protein
MSRLVALVVGVGLSCATLAPVFKETRAGDGYPFSTYPMFGRQLGKPVLYFAEGITDSGAAVRLPPRFVANGQPMQAMKTLRYAARAGGTRLKRLCRQLAERAAASPEHQLVRRVRIVQARFDPLRYFEAEQQPEEREVLGECRVGVKR